MCMICQQTTTHMFTASSVASVYSECLCKKFDLSLAKYASQNLYLHVAFAKSPRFSFLQKENRNRA